MEGTRVNDPTRVIDNKSNRCKHKGPNAEIRTEGENGKKRHRNGKLCEVGDTARATSWPEGLVLFHTGLHWFNDSCNSGETWSDSPNRAYPGRPQNAIIATKPTSSVVWGLGRND